MCTAWAGPTKFVIIEGLVAIQSEPLQHRSIHSPGSSSGPFFPPAKCCCAGKTDPPGVPERELFSPLYLFSAHKALGTRPISHYCLLHSQYFLKLRLGQEQVLQEGGQGMCVKGMPFTSLELNLLCLVITSEGSNVFFFIVILAEWVLLVGYFAAQADALTRESSNINSLCAASVCFHRFWSGQQLLIKLPH